MEDSTAVSQVQSLLQILPNFGISSTGRQMLARGTIRPFLVRSLLRSRTSLYILMSESGVFFALGAVLNGWTYAKKGTPLQFFSGAKIILNCATLHPLTEYVNMTVRKRKCRPKTHLVFQNHLDHPSRPLVHPFAVKQNCISHNM